MADDDRTSEKPSLRQRLHAATGDRDAEAAALLDDAPAEVTPEEAKVAVQRARGEAGADQPQTDGDVATPADAEEVHEEHDRP